MSWIHISNNINNINDDDYIMQNSNIYKYFFVKIKKIIKKYIDNAHLGNDNDNNNDSHNDDLDEINGMIYILYFLFILSSVC